MKYHYVLGYRYNPIVSDYLDQYYILIKEKFTALFEKWVITPTSYDKAVLDDRGFLLSPDISSLINNLHSQHIKNISFPTIDYNSILGILEMEIEYLLSWKNSDSILKKGFIIPDTSIKLCISDHNPSSGQNAHPQHAKNGSMISWWERPPEEWLSVYERVFSLLKNIDEDFFYELNTIIQKIVPFGTDKEVHNSASYQDAIGVLYMWYTIDTDVPEFNILEAITHESSHNKLNLIMHFQDIILNDKTESFYSPYRPDARHIYGIYLWVHALVPTINVMLRGVEKWLIQDTRWKWKILLYHIKNKIWMRVLKKYGIFSDLWNTILWEMEAINAINDTLVKTIGFKDIDISSIQQQARTHFEEVNNNYPSLKY